MWIPSHDMSHLQFDSFCVELRAGLSWSSITAALIPPLTAAYVAFELGHVEIRARERVAIESSSAVRRADKELDTDLRGFAGALEHHDRRGGRLGQFIFPEGVTHVTDVYSWKMLERAEDVLTRASSPALKGGEEVRATWLPIIRQRVEAMRQALEAREKAKAEVRTARRADQAHRRALVLEIDRIAGQLRVIFPGDPATRDAIWPRKPKHRRLQVEDQIDDVLDDFEAADELSDVGEITEVLPPPPVAPLDPTPPGNGHPTP